MECQFDINAAYWPVLDDKNRFIVVYGGAGSGKSYAVAQILLMKLMSEPGHKMLILRKVARTLRFSVFALFRQIISDLNLSEMFSINKTDMTIRFNGNGNEIWFLGLDNVEKLKSIVGITDAWIEEASEATEEDFNQVNLRLRGEGPVAKQITLTFNPISHLHWLKKYFFDQPKGNTSIYHTTYKDNHYLDKPYIEQLEALKDIDETYYNVYCLGEWGVLGNVIFTNWTVEKIRYNEHDYDAVYNGLDFGYNDPAALARVGVKDGELYIFDELYQSHLTNSELVTLLKNTVPSNSLITCDSSEPRTIRDLQIAGLKAVPAKKGRDSVIHGIKFLKQYKIHIDESCINAIREFQLYKWKEDKEGNAIETPVDINNHCIDALRYSVESLMINVKTVKISAGRLGL